MQMFEVIAIERIEVDAIGSINRELQQQPPSAVLEEYPDSFPVPPPSRAVLEFLAAF